MEFLAVGLYFFVLLSFIFIYRKPSLTKQDFIIGNRGMNRWMTALAAHASDMSNWLLMAYPGLIYLNGGRQLWVAIGLLVMMWLNWKWIAPKIRIATEKTNSLTLVDFFEKRLGGHWPSGRITTSLMLFLFYTVYIASALFGLGFLIELLFGAPYWVGVVGGVGVILAYVLIGGYVTLAQVDLFQGIFLLGVLIFVPFFVAESIGFKEVFFRLKTSGKALSLFHGSMWENILLMLGWGIGYFGQPHILTKFMGIKNVEEMGYSRRIGMTWLTLSLAAASLVGFIGIAFFGSDLSNHEHVFILMVRKTFPPFFSGLFLCAIIAAVINAVSSMLLVLSTTLSEDFYQRFIRKKASSKEALLVARISSICAALIGMVVALMSSVTIDQLVLYAWSGLGASFGPLLIMALYSKKLTPQGAWAGIVTGGGIVALWPFIGSSSIPALVVAFPSALGVIYLVSKLSREKVFSMSSS